MISVIIWDFDGTLYSHKKLGNDLKTAYFSYCLRNGNPALRLSDFDNLTEKYGRWSATTSMLTKSSELDIISYVENRIDKASYLNPKNRLVSKIEYLSNYKHLILSNSSRDQIKSCLFKLGYLNKQGFDIYPFEKIFGRDVTMALKPNTQSFRAILNYTKVSPNSHLVIGDSYSDDIIPAKNLGFQAIHISEILTFFPHLKTTT